MYTKDQFDRLLKTRKRWTGKQIGRLLLQMDVEELNGEEPVTNVNVVQPLVDYLSSPEDNRDYTLYANLYSGIVDAWNYIDASGNDAIANLAFMKSIITSLTDYSNAENFHRQQPVMITEKQFKEYKRLYQQRCEGVKTHVENELVPFLDLIGSSTINDDTYWLPDKSVRSYGKNASKVIKAYQTRYFTDDEVSLIRSIMQSTVTESEHQSKVYREKHKDELQSFDDDFNSAYRSIVSAYNSIQENNQWLKNNNLKDETIKKLKENNNFYIKEIQDKGSLIPRYKFETDNLVEATGKYISLIQQEQLKILYSQNISFNEALKQALKKYPYSFNLSEGDVPESDKEKQYPNIPFVPDKLNYADLLYANEKTTNIASSFFNYLYMIGKGNDTAKQKELDDFLRKHFSEFFEAIKKDLIKKYPKMDKALNEVTNSTSYIIPYIPMKSLATAGIEWAESWISDAEDVSFINVFPKEDREQARIFGFAVVHSHSHYPNEPEEDDNHKIGPLADIPIEQHYDIPYFVHQTLSHNDKALKYAVKSIRRFAVLQTAYEDYFKGIARIAGDKTFRDYDKTTAYSKLKKAIKSYEKSLYALISTLHMIIDDPDEELKLISDIKKRLPLVSLKPIKYKKKTIKDVASLLEESYLSSTPANTMSVLNAIAEGAEW